MLSGRRLPGSLTIKFLNTSNKTGQQKRSKTSFNRVEYVVQHIRKNPLQYPASKEKDIHRCVVVKQISLFFRIKGKDIELLVFWDNRQDPAKLNFNNDSTT